MSYCGASSARSAAESATRAARESSRRADEAVREARAGKYAVEDAKRRLDGLSKRITDLEDDFRGLAMALLMPKSDEAEAFREKLGVTDQGGQKGTTVRMNPR